MHASDIMTPDVITAAPGTDLSELARLMLERRISAVPILEDGVLVGIVSEGDLLRRPELGTAAPRPRWLLLVAGAAQQAASYVRTHGRKAGEVMTRDVVTIAEDTPVEAVAASMERHRIKRLPVLRGGRLVGIVTRADLLRALALRLAPPVRVEDGRVRAALLAEIGAQPWAPAPGDLSVIVRDGVVHLWGGATSEAQRAALVAAGESTPGARAVEDHLTILHPADPMDRPNWFTTPP